jgi:hypothetical protein
MNMDTYSVLRSEVVAVASCPIGHLPLPGRMARASTRGQRLINITDVFAPELSLSVDKKILSPSAGMERSAARIVAPPDRGRDQIPG